MDNPRAARAAIYSIGRATPHETATQSQAATFIGGKSKLEGTAATLSKTLHEKSGVERRHSVVLDATTPGEDPLCQQFYRDDGDPQGPSTLARMEVYAREAPALAIRACRDALVQSGYGSEAITHIICVSCTGFIAPGLEAHVIAGLSLRPRTHRTCVGYMGCHGAINALRLAQSIVLADEAAVVLLVCVELCTLHLQYTRRPDRMLANALFGDGAAAAVIASAGRPQAPRSPLALIESTDSYLVPDTQTAMGWDLTDHGFAMTLDKSVPAIIRAHLRAWLAEWLSETSCPLDRLISEGHFVVHPGGPRVVDGVRDALGIDESKLEVSREVLRNYGNMSSCTVLFIAHELVRRESKGPALLLAFGPGLAAEAALVTFL